MRSIRMAMALGVTLAFGAGCFSAPVVPPLGGAFTSISAPLDTDMDPTQRGSKVGRSESANVLGLFSFGDASVEAAARAGGLNTVNHADYEFFNILGLYQRYTTVVYGE